MKTKLLKKVRKRFEIIHLPKGIISFNDHYNYNLFKLIDKEKVYSSVYAQLHGNKKGKRFCDEIFDTEIECINYLKNRVITWLKSEGYGTRKANIINITEKKVWSI